jgi:alkylation response protein AidB-like acyl-CoA dehydrogenase
MRDVARRIAKERVAPRAEEIDEKAEYPHDIWDLCKENGLLAIPFPPEYGGAGGDLVTFCLVTEELAKVDANASMIPLTQDLGSLPIVIAGSEEIKRKYLPKLANGELHVSFTATEPGAGSDLGAMLTRAELRGDHYVLNGTKHYISYANVADIFTVFAKTDIHAGAKGISIFVVERNSPGLSLGKKEKKMSIKGAPAYEVVFEDCPVPKENILGKEGSGMRTVMGILNETRPLIGACAVGLAQGALDAAIRYAKERVQFGQPIANFQGIQWMLADMAMEIEAARQLVYKAAASIDQKASDVPMLSAMAKCYATDVAMKVTTDAVQILGGAGLMQDFPCERMMRDAKQCQIVEGTNQIQRVIIASQLLR